MQSFSTKIKEQIDYPSLVFRQVDRVCEIMSEPFKNDDKLARSIDALIALVFFLDEKKQLQPPQKKLLSDTEYYTQAQQFLASVMGVLHNKKMLVRDTGVGFVPGGLDPTIKE